ncbi:MAG: hypothetical protein RBS99_10825 [Rhodospirillales bacterium]|jgi:hypothetical protein|nr:hypothetical protein [Rhodospirillales bacterium]
MTTFSLGTKKRVGDRSWTSTIARHLAAASLAAGLAVAGPSPAAMAAIDTPHLVVSDATGTLAEPELDRLAGQAQALLERILAFWSADSGTERFGKIALIFDAPRRDAYSSVFYWENDNGRRRRVVRVFGFEARPQMLAHKLASAAFPQKDKLIRNAMGILTEMHLGNPLTFPLCGLDADDWVRAFINTGLTIPLAELGPEQESWGMRMAAGGRVSVFDRAKQHIAYAEAGSFGAYLYHTFGIDKMKRLHHLSQTKDRPMREAFGADLAAIEAAWLAAVSAEGKTRMAQSSMAARLMEAGPATACTEAQRSAADKP